MNLKLKLNIVLTSVAVVTLTFCLTAEAQSQRGFRIGNILRAGGGQGFRLGGTRLGTRLGVGQGSQNGRIQTTPSVEPGIDYYGRIKNRGNAQPVVQARPVMIPSTVVSPTDGVEHANFNAPTLAGPVRVDSAETTVSSLNSQIPSAGKSVLAPVTTSKAEERFILHQATPPAPAEQTKSVVETPIE